MVNAIAPDSGALGQPAVLRVLLGAQLRRLREASEITRDDAAYQIRASGSKISRIELGRVGVKERDLADLLTLYGVSSEPERQAMLALARQANQPGWWHKYSDVIPHWFVSYLGLEAATVSIETFEVQFVPGLLQTRDYARAVTALGLEPTNGFEVEERVELRMQRQAMFARPEGPSLRAVVDEAVLRRPIGGRQVMRDQIGALIEASQQPRVTLQVVPFEAGGHAASGGPFTILRFHDPDLQDFVYVEQATTALYIDERKDVDVYGQAMSKLRDQAASPQRTLEILTEIERSFAAA